MLMRLWRTWVRPYRTALVLVMGLLFLVSCSDKPAVKVEEPKQAFFDTSSHKGQLAIRYFNLESDEKSGDAILLTSPDGKHMLIDAGIPNAGPQLEERLNKLGIDNLDAVVSTHPHIDHIGGLTTLLHTKHVGAYYHNGISHDTETYRKVQKLLQDKGIQQTMLREGQQIQWSPEVTIDVLNPPVGTTQESFAKWGTEEINNHALVLLLTHGGNRVLLTADIYKNQEYALVEKYGEKLRAKLMHAPHHGDTTSSSGSFIRSIRPEIVVMSANHLQSLDILKRYEKEGAKVYNTGLNGNLLFISDGASITVYTEKNKQ